MGNKLGKRSLWFMLALFHVPLSFGGIVLEPPKMGLQFVYKDFSFFPGRSCETDWIDKSFCDATSPKPWREDEFATLAAWLSPLYSGRLEAFLRQVVHKGSAEFYRYGHGFNALENGKFTREEHAAWFWGRDRSINASDFAFAPFPQDPIGGFKLQEAGVLHELAHAFSYQEEDLMDEFNQLVGWSYSDGQWNLANANRNEVTETLVKMRLLMLGGKFIEGIRLNREYGIRHGFPTAYAMQNPRESFAEIASHIYFDPNAPNYLKPAVLTWFKKNVIR